MANIFARSGVRAGAAAKAALKPSSVLSQLKKEFNKIQYAKPGTPPRVAPTNVYAPKPTVVVKKPVRTAPRPAVRVSDKSTSTPIRTVAPTSRAQSPAAARIAQRAETRIAKLDAAAAVKAKKLEIKGAQAAQKLAKPLIEAGSRAPTGLRSVAGKVAAGAASIAGTIGALVGASVIMDNISRKDTSTIIDSEEEFATIWAALKALKEQQNGSSNTDWGALGVGEFTYPWGEGFTSGGYNYIDPDYPTGVDWVDATIADGGALVTDEYGAPYAVMDSEGNLTGLTDAEADIVNKKLNINPTMLVGTVAVAAIGGYALWRNRDGISSGISRAASKVPVIGPAQRRKFI